MYLEDAVTISLKTGDVVPLGEFVDTNNIMERVRNYTGTIYTDTGMEQWIENKDKDRFFLQLLSDRQRADRG